MNRAELERAFTEWDRRYRADPDTFMSDVEHLLGNTQATYGSSCAVYFEQLLKDTAESTEQTATVPATG